MNLGREPVCNVEIALEFKARQPFPNNRHIDPVESAFDAHLFKDDTLFGSLGRAVTRCQMREEGLAQFRFGNGCVRGRRGS